MSLPRKRRRSYYPAEPGLIHCWLCGTYMETYSWPRNEIPSIAFDKEEWVDAWRAYQNCRVLLRKQKFSIYTNSSDLDRTLESSWKNVFRTIIISKDEKYLPRGYHISGIGYLPGARTTEGKFVLSQRDPATACIGVTRRNKQALPVTPILHPFAERNFIIEYPRQGSSLEGYILHSRCWDLIKHRMGPEALSQLHLVIAALHRQWDNLLPRLGESEREQRSAYGLSLYQGWENRDMQDPLFIPELNNLLKECSQLPVTKGSRLHASPSLLTLRYRLPLEIKYHIASYLNTKDTYNMLVAFGEQFPVDFWKRKVPTDIIFELENRNPDTVNWPRLAVEIENRDLLETSDAVWNRKRILNMLVPIKEDFDSAAKQLQDIHQPSSGAINEEGNIQSTEIKIN